GVELVRGFAFTRGVVKGASRSQGRRKCEMNFGAAIFEPTAGREQNSWRCRRRKPRARSAPSKEAADRDRVGTLVRTLQWLSFALARHRCQSPLHRNNAAPAPAMQARTQDPK